MSEPLLLRDISGVRFGVPGTVVINGTDFKGATTGVSIPVLALTNLIPELAKAITATYYARAHETPPPGSPVPECLVAVLDGHAFAAKDTKEPGLTLHTSAGTLQFHCAPAVAAQIGKDLLRIATAALPPAPSKRN